VAHFLSTVLGGAPFSLRIERSGALLGTALVIAGDSATRREGLLGQDSLSPGSGLVIAPSQGVHTFGMRFPIDVVCVTRGGVVVKYRSAVPPRRLVLAWSAFAMIELAAGESARAGVVVGDLLVAQSS
jgi:uncharacterized membrane protein (UPF0127 family)